MSRVPKSNRQLPKVLTLAHGCWALWWRRRANGKSGLRKATGSPQRRAPSQTTLSPTSLPVPAKRCFHPQPHATLSFALPRSARARRCPGYYFDIAAPPICEVFQIRPRGYRTKGVCHKYPRRNQASICRKYNWWTKQIWLCK